MIKDAGYGEQFIHRTGHGIGVTTHEPPYPVEGEEQPLVRQVCASPEPGINVRGKRSRGRDHLGIPRPPAVTRLSCRYCSSRCLPS